MRLEYLCEKIRNTSFSHDPFPHVYIENFFSNEDFTALIRSPEINLSPAQTDEALFDSLSNAGYEKVNFPGTANSIEDYIKWRTKKELRFHNDDICESVGITMRLKRPIENTPAAEVFQFLASDGFNQTLLEKFDITCEDVHFEHGVQKYMDGYEISPHPDVRRKALTFMANINPAPNSESLEYHTSYLRLKPEWRRIQEFWENYPEYDRFWMPWDWCNIVTRQIRNNSIVIFSPGNNTLHAVKATYNHLKTQRTQLYGNVWRSRDPTMRQIKWKEALAIMSA